jgi:DeoR/GlpR family transcriptional regulator of sugar metabolism
MIPHERRQAIMKVLERQGSAQVAELSQVLRVTEVTVRKDLSWLEAEGSVVKEHGGAVLRASPEKLLEAANRTVVNVKAKYAIAKKAAEFIDDGDAVLIDAGSTAVQLAKCLFGKNNMTVVTTSMCVALNVGTIRSANILMPGGQFHMASMSFTGPQTAEFFNGIHAEKLFFSAAGVSLLSGLTYLTMDDVFIKRSMLKSVRKAFLLADSSKMGKESLIKLGTVTLAHVLITDSGIPDEYRESLIKRGMEVVVADV